MCRVVEEEGDLLEYSLWELPLLLTWAKSIQWNTHCYRVWVGTTHIVSFPGPIEAFIWFTRKDIETYWTWVSYPGWHRCGHWEGNSDLCSFLELRKEIWIWIVLVLMDYKLNEGVLCLFVSWEKLSINEVLLRHTWEDEPPFITACLWHRYIDLTKGLRREHTSVCKAY